MLVQRPLILPAPVSGPTEWTLPRDELEWRDVFSSLQPSPATFVGFLRLPRTLGFERLTEADGLPEADVPDCASARTFREP